MHLTATTAAAYSQHRRRSPERYDAAAPPAARVCSTSKIICWQWRQRHHWRGHSAAQPIHVRSACHWRCRWPHGPPHAAAQGLWGHVGPGSPSIHAAGPQHVSCKCLVPRSGHCLAGCSQKNSAVDCCSFVSCNASLTLVQKPAHPRGRMHIMSDEWYEASTCTSLTDHTTLCFLTSLCRTPAKVPSLPWALYSR